ncbi:flagellar filament capping protein FliD [Nesterenkonia lutea]|uniref:Flagellar hook-associated protein 2 n=1 Tax=Nesterenkonia lutea TaxID=272919 RepID=A0ABR9JFE2_9MICC|nr:flagellar filament capping protein FliD [Nesterenkonia lutea]MBE1524649.1 flagellar hook-associated protein 2 [Nesterenkonia lutea]
MSIALPGLASGLDSAALIESLMQVEAVPQQLLQRQASKTNTFVAALQGLNTRVAAVAESSAEIAKPDALRAFTAQSSSQSVTATASSAYAAGSLDFTVESTALRHTLVTGAVAEWDTEEFSITAADGTTTAITSDSTGLDDVVKAINASGAGVNAVKIPVGDGTHRLQLSAAETGSDGAFTLGGSAVGSTVTSAGADASLTLWAGTAAEQRVTSASNTFEGLMPGVDVQVSAVSTTPVTVTVARDAEASTTTAESLVTSVNSVLSYIRTNSKVATGSDGSTSAGVLTGDSAVRSAQQRMSDAVIRPVDGRSPSEIGISVTRDGELTFDKEKFAAALAADPSGVEATVAQLATRINDVATQLSDRYDGQITQRITGQEGLANRLTDQVEQWDDRLANRRATLERTYAALEVQMQSLNSQMDYLSSQLASLPQSSSQKNS